ncbi:MAG TPA: toll/interleukin-1 receptor domain-containing protein [Isosphaeraceae bacterium]|jgi:hypothetical protein|nr:toll/interleukin-1 receptor domain-containing protein [Isosphaeraceae bacterium]
MGFVHPDKSDLFISYAHENNEPLFDGADRWVSRLHQTLRNSLAGKIGRSEDFEIWKDERLRGNVPLTEQLEGRVRETAAILIVLSPSYMTSVWCRRELGRFLEAEVGRRKGPSTSIFVVEFDQAERPPDLADLLGYRFWAERENGKTRTLGKPRLDASESLYFERLDDLTVDLVKELRRQRGAAAATDGPAPMPVAAPPRPPGGGATVYLAEATDDVDEERDEVRRFLVQFGYEVLPQSLYPRDNAEVYRAAAAADVARCDLFVQILGEFPGKRLPGSEGSLVGLQHECGIQLGKPVLQWRHPDVDLGAVRRKAPAYEPLLNGPTVIVEDMQKFKEIIHGTLVGLKAPKPTPKKQQLGRDRLVFVNADPADRGLAEALGEELLRREIGYVLPLLCDQPADLRQDLEQNIRECDALMLVFGKSEPLWVRSQLMLARKMAARREDPLSVIGIYEGPPAPKSEDMVGVRLPNIKMVYLDCTDRPDGAQIDRFLEAFESRAEA